MACISRDHCELHHVMSKIKFNDRLTDDITPSRGLRQGIPSHPTSSSCVWNYLITGLWRRLGLRRGRFQNIKISRSAPGISHVFFTDDSIIFFKAEEEQAHTIRNVIRRYENVSGQRVNFRKSEIVFSGNMGAQKKQEIMNVLQVKEVASHGKYLGLPLVIGQKKSDAFKELIGKMWKKTMEWKHKLLSQAGREVLIRSVPQSMPLYMMAVYLFP
ncbi:hypothetical protein QQ045_015867 [Rhodiola kirilowii]